MLTPRLQKLRDALEAKGDKLSAPERRQMQLIKKLDQAEESLIQKDSHVKRLFELKLRPGKHTVCRECGRPL